MGRPQGGAAGPLLARNPRAVGPRTLQVWGGAVCRLGLLGCAHLPGTHGAGAGSLGCIGLQAAGGERDAQPRGPGCSGLWSGQASQAVPAPTGGSPRSSEIAGDLKSPGRWPHREAHACPEQGQLPFLRERNRLSSEAMPPTQHSCLWLELEAGGGGVCELPGGWRVGRRHPCSAEHQATVCTALLPRDMGHQATEVPQGATS